MDLSKIPNVRKSKDFSHKLELETDIGDMLINLSDKHLTCNFFNNEMRAKEIFGHWKVNTFVETEQDIIEHIDFIQSRIKKYIK